MPKFDAINDSGANPEYNLDEPTMEEKLATLNLLNGGGDGTAGEATQEQPLPVVMPPSADSVHVLLKQALRADDHASLLNCLYNKDHKVIVNSISLVTPADAVKLLKFFILLMQSRGRRIPADIYEDKDTDDEESEVDDMETSGEGEDLGGVTDASEHSDGSEVMSD
ncbi:hypothetical protein OsI_39252 [Oryza sativa Indica Group]|uniref:Uncharacterized protein n=1 Tax=Oryza sativa subsp. indica TaxID=39946 RepID=B8BN64_ORYSI|nr:hypothetical protein OsI_39252 [Oryza sativa Indica Group]